MFGSLSLWRLQHMLNGGNDVAAPAHDDYSVPITGYDFNEELARQQALRASRGALAGGLLDAYLSGGQNAGRAFELQRHAYDTSIDRAHEVAQQRLAEARQRQIDAAVEAERQARIHNLDVDNERQRRESEARAAELAAKHADEQAEQARVAAQRERLLKDNPAAVDFSPKQVEAEYTARYGYHEPDKPQEISPGAYLRDPHTGEIIYHAPERPERDKPPTPAELRAQRSEEQRQIKSRADELYDEWLSGLSPQAAWGITERDKAKARLDARHRAEKEAGINTSSPDATDSIGKSSASARLHAVTDAATRHKIDVARSHHYTDEQIAQFLGL